MNAINEAIGANGKTIDWNTPVNYRQGIDAEMVTLTEDLNAGNVGALFVYGANPAYSYFDAEKFVAGIKKCPFTVSYSEKMDETTELCKYVIPSHHWLESWGDAEPQAGYVSVIQPIIHPLFKTRQFETSLLKLTGNANEYEAYFRNYWITKLGSLENYEKFLQDGVMENSNLKTQSAFVNTSNLTSATAGVTASTIASSPDSVSKESVATTSLVAAWQAPRLPAMLQMLLPKFAAIKGAEIEMVLYQKVSMGTGSRANNAWLQEVSDPISKATWDNYAMISPQMGKTLFDIDIFSRRDMDKYEVHPEKPVIKITTNGKTMEIPVLIIPGIHPNVIAVAVGYGRQSNDKNKTVDYIGAAANGVGINVYPFAVYNGSTVMYSAPVTVEKTGNTYPIAQTQVHRLQKEDLL